ncbi:uncharacterized protein LOC136080771 isoform X1 [Hydra vulgaris]|uniref:Uncharacterized protein LOC136080771 isoform X1 n=1 Tax=Hydra vulgaris TaxID=6087 RepID=A0ABM4BXH8_HYDVU
MADQMKDKIFLRKREKCQPENVAKYYIQRKIDQEGFLKVKINDSIAEQEICTIKEHVIPADVIESETGRKKYPKRSFHEVDFTKISVNDSKLDGAIKIKQVLKLEKEKAINKKKILTVEKKLWNKTSKVAFYKEFAVHLEKNRGYPGRKEMEVFAKKFSLDLKQIRTRIVNTRRIKQNFRKKTVALMGIDEC